MPLSSTKQGVAERYKKAAEARVEQHAQVRLDRLQTSIKLALAQLDATVTAHFDAADKAGTNPYPEQHNRATIAVLSPDAFASGNNVEEQTALTALDARETQLLAARVTHELKQAGFDSQVTLRPAEMFLSVVVWDPQFKPVAEAQVANTRFNDELKKV